MVVMVIKVMVQLLVAVVEVRCCRNRPKSGNNNGGAGGTGRNNSWSTGSNITYGGGGGGGGAGSGGTGGTGGPGGGGTGQTQGSAPDTSAGGYGTLGLGAGGGGGASGPGYGNGGNGGSGLCVVRYVRGISAGTAKATWSDYFLLELKQFIHLLHQEHLLLLMLD